MNTTKIDYAQTGYFSGLITSYLKKGEQLQNFYSFFPDKEGFEKAINNRKYSFDRNLLADVITQQNVSAGASPSDKVLKNIELLRKTNTFTVATGHQLCIFTGPLYFIYKIITTINLAAELKLQHPEKDFVPVFWMASEDHDFEEVNHIHLFHKKLSWNPEHAVKGPVGKYSPSRLSGLLEELKPILGEGENAQKLFEVLNNAYSKTNTLSDATRFLANELFKDYGLLCLDGDSPELKEALMPVMMEDIFHQSSFTAVNKSIEELHQQGIQKIQVSPREINFFYMKPGLRERIEQQGEKFVVLNTGLVFSKAELEQEIQEHPEHFSPNVVLRPLYQEMILPNIAYIGGGGELAYWLELKNLFNHHEIDFPVLLLRNSLLWIDTVSAEKMQKLGISAADLFQETEALIKDFVARNAEQEINLEEQMEKLKEVYHEISEVAFKVDPTLKPTVEADLQKALQSLKHLEHKISKAEKNKHETAINQLRKLKEKLFPGNGLQERFENFIPYYLKYGPRYIEVLKEELRPLNLEFNIISEKVKLAEQV
ncbi:MAG: bacillithiol biosynthesis cysteine-adding enzyme BshC [Bacteroidetes bacterium]|nr:bacillithiol biosynthesis cysteine-adding enzyme BshC [Bacteroidota bacterium]